MQLTSKTPLPVSSVSRHRALWMGMISLNLLLIAALDQVTGVLPVHHFYYLPIILAAIHFRKTGGLLVACASVVLYQLVNPNLWQWQNAERDVLQLIIFIGVGLVTAKLVEDAERMRLLAHTDDLTGLHNLRSFEAHYALLLHVARMKQTPLSLVILDLDHLKDLNARFGHLAGAQAIQTLGHIIADQLPANAVACRYGGDEFVIALPNCSGLRARRWAENWRVILAHSSPTLAGYSLPPRSLTLSAGVADIVLGESDDLLAQGEALFQAADKALYQAKELGRDRVHWQIAMIQKVAHISSSYWWDAGILPKDD